MGANRGGLQIGLGQAEAFEKGMVLLQVGRDGVGTEVGEGRHGKAYAQDGHGVGQLGDLGVLGFVLDHAVA